MKRRELEKPAGTREQWIRTPNVDVVGWLIARVTGQSPPAVPSERLWSRIGAEDDACLQVDGDGAPLTGSSLNAPA